MARFDVDRDPCPVNHSGERIERVFACVTIVVDVFDRRRLLVERLDIPVCEQDDVNIPFQTALATDQSIGGVVNERAAVRTAGGERDAARGEAGQGRKRIQT